MSLMPGGKLLLPFIEWGQQGGFPNFSKGHPWVSIDKNKVFSWSLSSLMLEMRLEFGFGRTSRLGIRPIVSIKKTNLKLGIWG